MEIEGTLDGVYLYEDDISKPARVRIVGDFYSTFDREILKGFQEGDKVKIEYHIVKGKFRTIDKIIRLETSDEDVESKVLLVNKAKEKIHKEIDKIMDKLEEKLYGA